MRHPFCIKKKTERRIAPAIYLLIVSLMIFHIGKTVAHADLNSKVIKDRKNTVEKEQQKITHESVTVSGGKEYRLKIVLENVSGWISKIAVGKDSHNRPIMKPVPNRIFEINGKLTFETTGRSKECNKKYVIRKNLGLVYKNDKMLLVIFDEAVIIKAIENSARYREVNQESAGEPGLTPLCGKDHDSHFVLKKIAPGKFHVAGEIKNGKLIPTPVEGRIAIEKNQGIRIGKNKVVSTSGKTIKRIVPPINLPDLVSKLSKKIKIKSKPKRKPDDGKALKAFLEKSDNNYDLIYEKLENLTDNNAKQAIEFVYNIITVSGSRVPGPGYNSYMGKKLLKRHKIPEALSGISKYGKKNNLAFILFEPQKEKQISPDFKAIPVKIKIEGSKGNLVNYFSGIQKSPYLSALSEINLGMFGSQNQVTALEKVDLSQLKLIAVIGNQRQALLEDASGKGYVVKIGTPIGLNSGKVLQILKGRIIIKEKSKDGYRKTTIKKVGPK